MHWGNGEEKGDENELGDWGDELVGIAAQSEREIHRGEIRTQSSIRDKKANT